MEKHVTVLGILYIVFNVLGLIAAFVVFFTLVGSGLLSGEESAIAITAGIGSAISFFLVIVSLPGIIGGIGLLKWQSWARILTLVLGFINLINIPFGTILGGYTIWVLMKDETIKLFETKKAL